jgi:hypothetical protein
VTTNDRKDWFDFEAVTSRAALPPGDFIVEVDGNKFPFPGTDAKC